MKRYEFNPKEMLFLDALIEQKGHIKNACRQAHVSWSFAKGLLRDPRFQSEMRRRLPMTAQEVLMQISTLARKSLEDLVVVVKDEDGQVIEATIRTADWLRSLELMAKYHDLLGERREKQEPTQVVFNFIEGGIAGQKALPASSEAMEEMTVEGELVN